MQALSRPLLLLGVVLLVPIVPFVIFGDQLEGWFRDWAEQTLSRSTVALVVVSLLATDILLPIPSSLVSTFGGSALGTVAGTLASWAGMTLGGVFGFALARWLGAPFAQRITRPQDLQQLAWASDRYGPLVLVLARGVPVFAEASVLLLGMHRLSWRRFLPAVIASNCGIALAYSAFGTWAAERAWLPMALGISVALPLLCTMMARRWLRAHATRWMNRADAQV
ncbi:MAG: TVP38/TMEM64 family protein [Pirellulaceae bacterium]